jgi:hypothetical protein
VEAGAGEKEAGEEGLENMSDSSDLDFVAFTDSKGQNVFLNIHLIRLVTFGEDGLDLWFSETYKIHINGADAVKNWLQRLSDRSMALLDGKPVGPEFKKQILKKDPAS